MGGRQEGQSQEQTLPREQRSKAERSEAPTAASAAGGRAGPRNAEQAGTPVPAEPPEEPAQQTLWSESGDTEFSLLPREFVVFQPLLR